MQKETIKIIEDMICWLHELKGKYYGHRQLGGVEEREYLELIKIVDKAHKHIADAKHNARAKHYVED